MKYTVIPGVILTKICDEDFLVATGPARGRVPYVEGINSTGAYFFSKILDGLSTEEIIKQASNCTKHPNPPSPPPSTASSPPSSPPATSNKPNKRKNLCYKAKNSRRYTRREF